MTLAEYQHQSKRTCPTLGSDKIDLAHMVLGICSEYSEYLEACEKLDYINVGEELADSLWYISNYCTFRGYNFSEIYENRAIEEGLEEKTTYNTSKLQDLVKKYVAYNKPININDEVTILKALCWSINDSIEFYELKIPTILENNINKLKVRFPEKFTEENALNRDLEGERKELEQ